LELNRLSRSVYRNKGSKDNIVISIAGAHGVGKTTIFNLLKKKISENSKFKFFPERYRKIPPYPFGSKDKGVAFKSEIHFYQQLVKRNQSIINYDERYNGRVIFLDRTPLYVLIYSKSLNLKEKDYQIILDLFNSIKWREDYIIYLTAEPELILKRIIQRGSLEKIRKEWNELEMEYLLKILSYYHKFLLNTKVKDKVFIINTDALNPEEAIEKIEEVITELTGFYFGKVVKPSVTQMSLSKFIK